VNERVCDEITLTAEFRNVPKEVLRWKGFRGRVLKYDSIESDETGYKLIYRKKFQPNVNYKVEMKAGDIELHPKC
jgi:hypothetical protein